jgi:hypothetical protein
MDWNTTLAKARLREFHGRTTPPQTAEEFTEIIGRHIPIGLGYTAVGAKTAEAYEKAFVDCLLHVATLSGMGGPLSVVFAKHPEFRPGRARRFAEIVNVDDARLGSITFDDPGRIVPLQAADLVARLIRQEGVAQLGGCRIVCFEDGRLVT